MVQMEAVMEQSLGGRAGNRNRGDDSDFIVVLIALVLIFKSKLTSLVNEIFDKITSQSRLV